MKNNEIHVLKMDLLVYENENYLLKEKKEKKKKN